MKDSFFETFKNTNLFGWSLGWKLKIWKCPIWHTLHTTHRVAFTVWQTGGLRGTAITMQAPQPALSHSDSPPALGRWRKHCWIAHFVCGISAAEAKLLLLLIPHWPACQQPDKAQRCGATVTLYAGKMMMTTIVPVFFLLPHIFPLKLYVLHF